MVRWLAVISLIVVIPVLGQEKSSDKKSEAKKEASPVKKYLPAGTITAKLTKANPNELTIEIDARVPGGKYGHNEKQEHSLVDDVKIRTMKLPDRVDEKNKPIPYTSAEKAKLKGDDPKLPGYTAELSALNAGQIVELHLSTTKPVPGAKKKDKNAEPEKPFVTMIVILGDAPKMPDKDKAKSGEKKKEKP